MALLDDLAGRKRIWPAAFLGAGDVGAEGEQAKRQGRKAQDGAHRMLHWVQRFIPTFNWSPTLRAVMWRRKHMPRIAYISPRTMTAARHPGKSRPALWVLVGLVLSCGISTLWPALAEEEPT